MAIESVRQQLNAPPWIFWGMSGGGWLAQIYARRHPEALPGIIIESACANFRKRLENPACALSPAFPAWQSPLETANLLPCQGKEDADEPLEWIEVPQLGEALRRRNGPALLVSPVPLSAQMRAAIPGFMEFDSKPWLHSIETRSLIIGGTADPVVPLPCVRELHECIAGSELLIVEGGQHVPSLIAGEECSRTIQRFVAG